MSVRAHLGVHEKPIEQAEAPGERVVVRRVGSRKEYEGCVAVALRHVAQHLVVRPILLDDVDDVLERRVRGVVPDVPPAVRALDSPRQARELRAAHARHRRGDDRPVELAQRVRPRPRRVHSRAGMRIVPVR